MPACKVGTLGVGQAAHDPPAVVCLLYCCSASASHLAAAHVCPCLYLGGLSLCPCLCHLGLALLHLAVALCDPCRRPAPSYIAKLGLGMRHVIYWACSQIAASDLQRFIRAYKRSQELRPQAPKARASTSDKLNITNSQTLLQGRPNSRTVAGWGCADDA